MFNVGGQEFMLIMLVALLVLGPERLPGAVRKFGQIVAELRRVSGGFQAEIREAMAEPMEAVKDVRKTVDDVAKGFKMENANIMKPQIISAPAPAAAPTPAVEAAAATAKDPFGKAVSTVGPPKVTETPPADAPAADAPAADLVPAQASAVEAPAVSPPDWVAEAHAAAAAAQAEAGETIAAAGAARTEALAATAQPQATAAVQPETASVPAPGAATPVEPTPEPTPVEPTSAEPPVSAQPVAAANGSGADDLPEWMRRLQEAQRQP